MKKHIKNLFLLPLLIAGLDLILPGQVTAQTFTTLYSFMNTYGTNGPGSIITEDGSQPRAVLILAGNTLYGTAATGGSPLSGTVFKVNTDGAGFSALYSFTALSNSPPYESSDGGFPQAGLILAGNTLYGTALSGGSSGVGTVFKINTEGSDLTTLHSFTAISSSFPYTNSDGYNPYAGLILSGTTVYGVAYMGGSSAGGTVFAVNTDGSGFTNLHSFKPSVQSTNSEGSRPFGGLVLAGNTLYGTTEQGGAGSSGTVFKLKTDGTGFTNLHSFISKTDGAHPRAGLILAGNTLYGTTLDGLSAGNGTVFKLNTDGTGFTNLHSFTATSGWDGPNSDGSHPNAGLILAGNTLYGTATWGGLGFGTVFAVNTDGSGFANLHSFTVPSFSFPHTNSDGVYPAAGLILAGSTLYGTAEQGGSGGNGTVFSLSLGLVSLPQLSIIRSVANVIVTWPTNATGFTLQSTTNLGPAAVWSTSSPSPVIINGQYTVTYPISANTQFFRLSQ